MLQQGGLSPGGLNFDCKVRRESTDIDDRFIAHIGAMDTFARGLLAAARIINDKTLSDMVKKRYQSFDTGIGKKAEDGTLTFEVGCSWSQPHTSLARWNFWHSLLYPAL